MIQVTGDVVVIHWIDCCIEEATLSAKESREVEPLECVTCGFLLAEDDASITVATDHFDDNRYRHIQAFPKCQILSITRLKNP